MTFCECVYLQLLPKKRGKNNLFLGFFYDLFKHSRFSSVCLGSSVLNSTLSVTSALFFRLMGSLICFVM